MGDEMKDYNLSLAANGKPIELTGFPQDFVIKTLIGMVSSLKGVQEINSLELTLRYGKVKLSINGNPISVGPFPTLITAKTLIAIASTLKGVENEITSLEIKMEAKPLPVRD